MRHSNNVSTSDKLSLTDTVPHPSLQEEDQQTYSRKHGWFSAQAPQAAKNKPPSREITRHCNPAKQKDSWDRATHLSSLFKENI